LYFGVGIKRGESDEGQVLSKTDMREVQDNQAQGQGHDRLLRSKAQTETGIIF
jgi:hypothetical protein